jgi:hypothetical protein
MTDLIVTIPFKPDLFKENRKAIWAYSTLNVYKSYTTYTVMALVCLLIGIYAENDHKYSIGVIVGGGFLIHMLFAWIGLIERWINFNKITKSELVLHTATPQNCTFTFSDEYLLYEDSKLLTRLSWDLLTTYNVYKSTIIIRTKDQKQVLIAIGKYQIDHEVYTSIRSFLDKKVG